VKPVDRVRHRVLLVGSLRAACCAKQRPSVHTTSPLTAWSIHPRHTPKRAASLPGSTATTCSSQDGWQHWSTLRSAAGRLWARLAPAVGDCRGARVRRAPQRMCKRKRLRRMESAAQRQAPGCGGGDGEGQSRTRRPSNLIPALCGAIIRHCNRTATTTRTCMQAHTPELASLRASQRIL
jgi:hypothetical protein